MKKSKFMLAALLGLYASTSLSSAAVTPTEPQKNSDGYYLISDYAELVWFRDYVNLSTNSGSAENKAKAQLTADIDAPADEQWNESIGKLSSKGGFAGIFNGQGHSIKNLNIEPMNNGSMGVFGTLKGSGQILNLTIENAKCGVKSDQAGVAGGIVTTIENGEIINCGFSGDITANNSATVGGICGNFEKGEIRDCYATGNFKGSVSCAGIAGEMSNGHVTLCYVNATLSGKNTYAIGYEKGDESSIKDCYYTTATKNDAGATSDADFKSGKITYLLNNGEKTPFKQTIGTDAFPSFNGETVYQYKHCTGEPRYTNDKDQQDLHHIFSDKFEAKAPTCTTKGNNVYWLCEHEPGVYYKNPNDGHYETYANESEVFIPALGHHMVEHKEEAAKCEKDGNLLYYTCENELGVYYKDAKATKTTTLAAVTIPATGHQLEQHTLSAQTCTESGETNYVYYTCKNDPTEFFSKDGVTPIKDPQEAINDVVGHDWPDTWTFVKTEDNQDIFTRTCKRNPDHTETTYSPHAWSEWELVESEPDHDKYVHSCTSTYGTHSEEKVDKFRVEEVTYYSQKTGERDTTFRINTEFKAVDTKNDLLLAGNTTTITGNNVVAGDVCKNLVITDKVDFSTPTNFVAENLSYTRNDVAKYQTFTLPYDVPLTSFNGKVYSFAEYVPETRLVRFKSINIDLFEDFTKIENGEKVVKAGTPCILWNEETDGKTEYNLHNNLENIKIGNATVQTIANNQCFYFGTFKYINEEIPSGSYTKYYGFVNDQFVKAKESYQLPQYRAAIRLVDTKPSPAPFASLGLIFDDELTGVATIDAEGNLTTGNVDVYDMTGRLVRKSVESATCLQGLKPGIYVVNGEKFVKTAND